MKLKKIAAAAAAAVMVLAMLTACSGGGGGGVAVKKKIIYKDSRLAKIVSINQVYFEEEMMQSGITTNVKVARKNGKTSMDTYVGDNHWTTMIEKDDKNYYIEYPDCPNYKYNDKDGNKLTIPVYRVNIFASGEIDGGILDGYDDDTEVDVGTYPVDGKNYYAESITDEGDNTETYCFDGMKIVAIVETKKDKQPHVTPIKNFRTTEVPDGLFELPVGAVDADTLK